MGRAGISDTALFFSGFVPEILEFCAFYTVYPLIYR